MTATHSALAGDDDGGGAEAAGAAAAALPPMPPPDPGRARHSRDTDFTGPRLGSGDADDETETLLLAHGPRGVSCRQVLCYAMSMVFSACCGFAIGATVFHWGVDNSSPDSPPPENCLHVLFVGNSFTYGPSPVGQPQLNNLPRMFKLVAESLGKCAVVAEDTIGACTLYAHRPSVNPDGCAPCKCPDWLDQNASCEDRALSCGCGCRTAATERLPASMNCTIPAWGIDANEPQYHPCPQLAQRGPPESATARRWDVIVLQDHSQLPTVRRAREQMLVPSVEEYARVARHQGARLALYMTWAYYSGTSVQRCPGGETPGCFPLGHLDELVTSPASGKGNCSASDTKPDADTASWRTQTASFACQGYALARGYEDAAERAGAAFLVPAGLAWQAATGQLPDPEFGRCRDAVDETYAPQPASRLPSDWPAVRGAGAEWAKEKAHELYLFRGADYNSTYCADGCHHDDHPSALGMYLNALVFYATLFGESPVGAAVPNGQMVDGERLPGAGMVRGTGRAGKMTAAEALALQRTACLTAALGRWRRDPTLPAVAYDCVS